MCIYYYRQYRGRLNFESISGLPVSAVLCQEPAWTRIVNGVVQWRIQDLRKGGAISIAREARAQKFKPRPPINAFLKVAG